MFLLLAFVMFGMIAVTIAVAKVVTAAHDQCSAGQKPRSPAAATPQPALDGSNLPPFLPASLTQQQRLPNVAPVAPEPEPFSWLEPAIAVHITETAFDGNAEHHAATPPQRAALRASSRCDATSQNIVVLPAMPTDLYADPIDGSPIHSGEDFILCLCGTGYHVETLAWLQECNAGVCVQCNRTLDRKVYRVACEEQEADLSMAS